MTPIIHRYTAQSSKPPPPEGAPRRPVILFGLCANAMTMNSLEKRQHPSRLVCDYHSISGWPIVKVSAPSPASSERTETGALRSAIKLFALSIWKPGLLDLRRAGRRDSPIAIWLLHPSELLLGNHRPNYLRCLEPRLQKTARCIQLTIVGTKSGGCRTNGLMWEFGKQ